MAHRAAGTTHAWRGVLVLVLTASFVAAPSVRGEGGSTPESSTRTVSLDLSDANAHGRWRVSPASPAEDVVLLAASWDAAAATRVQVRTERDGSWSRWMPFQVQHEHGPDELGDRPAAHEHDHDHDDDHDEEPGGGDVTSDPLWLGQVERIQLRADGPAELELSAVTMSGEPMLAHEARPPSGGAVLASVGPPAFVSRSAWDPQGLCRPDEAPEYGEVRMAHVHHTVMYPRYAPEEADDVVRALCLFHTELRGWSDLGYNFLIDKYGRIYEGRAGGAHRPVVGAHAAGFNAVSVGVSFIGDFETDPVPEQALAALERLLAWKFTAHDVNPIGRTRVVSTGGQSDLSRFARGAVAELPTVVGHRDTGAGTLCPGRYLYAAMERSPQRTADIMLAAGVELAPADPPPIEVAGDDSTSVEEHHPGPGEEAEPGEVVAASATTLPATGWGAVALSLLTLCIAAFLGEVTSRRRRPR